jgi:hypothetical protein
MTGLGLHLPDRKDGPSDSVRSDDPRLVFEAAGVYERHRHRALDVLTVFGMNEFKEGIERASEIFLGGSEDAEEFVRPPHLVLGDLPRPTAEMR